jgi:glycosyltransferase involved in cell wall biosynthesis
MSKFWINVSSSIYWHGTPVGIIRVEKELSHHIVHTPFVVDHSGFKKLDVTSKAIIEIKTDGFRDDDKVLNKATNFLRSTQLFPRPIRLIKSLGYLISSVYGLSNFTDRIIDKLTAFVYRSARTFTKMNYKKRVVSKAFSKEKLEEWNSEILETKSPFSENDIILTCGLDWDNSILEKFDSLKQKKNVKVVVVIYDLIPITFPEYIQNSRHTSRLFGHFTLVAQIADLVLINTAEVENQFKTFCAELEIQAPATRIVPWGVGLDTTIDSREAVEVINKAGDNGYLLAVGTIEIRKNYELLVRIVHLAREKQIQIPHFVFVGVAGWGTSDLLKQIASDEKLEKSITWLSGVEDGELKWLYENCLGLLSPSFSEGYGLPVAEAKMFTKPTFLSDIPVYRELFPDSIFLSPNDPAEWLRAITQVGKSIPDRQIPLAWNQVSKIVAKEIGDFFQFEIESK